MIRTIEALLILFAIVTYMENIIYPENQLRGSALGGKVTVSYLIGILLVIYNNFKSISGKAIFYKEFFLLSLFLLQGIFKTQAQQNVNHTLYSNIIYHFNKYINWPYDSHSQIRVESAREGSDFYLRFTHLKKK
jgi:hypothetical protein